MTSRFRRGTGRVTGPDRPSISDAETRVLGAFMQVESGALGDGKEIAALDELAGLTGLPEKQVEDVIHKLMIDRAVGEEPPGYFYRTAA